MTKWEYTSIPIAKMQVQQLNEMGQLGWELVTVVSVPTRNDLDFVFKRPIEIFEAGPEIGKSLTG